MCAAAAAAAAAAVAACGERALHAAARTYAHKRTRRARSHAIDYRVGSCRSDPGVGPSRLLRRRQSKLFNTPTRCASRGAPSTQAAHARAATAHGPR
eukprot:4489289-Prymnesium_polylepis.1